MSLVRIRALPHVDRSGPCEAARAAEAAAVGPGAGAVGRGGMRILAGGGASLALTLILAMTVTLDVGGAVREGARGRLAPRLAPGRHRRRLCLGRSIAHDIVQARRGDSFWWESIHPAYLGVVVGAVGGAFLVGAVGDGAIPPSAWSLFPSCSAPPSS